MIGFPHMFMLANGQKFTKFVNYTVTSGLRGGQQSCKLLSIYKSDIKVTRATRVKILGTSLLIPTSFGNSLITLRF